MFRVRHIPLDTLGANVRFHANRAPKPLGRGKREHAMFVSLELYVKGFLSSRAGHRYRHVRLRSCTKRVGHNANDMPGSVSR